MRYVTYDETGKLTGCYKQDLQPSHAGRHLEVSREIAASWPLYRMNAGRNGVELAPAAPVTMEAHNAPILAELARIDAKSIRALREGDAARIADYEAQAAALRLQLRKE